MSFHGQDFAKRFTAMGDEAEAVFEAVYPEGFVRWGLNRPPLRLSDIPRDVRMAPDYLTSKGFVEVVGFGRDNVLKLKTEKFEALEWWNRVFRTDLFVWHSTSQHFGWVRIPELAAHVADVEPLFFHDGPAYYPLDGDELPVIEWMEHDA